MCIDLICLLHYALYGDGYRNTFMVMVTVMVLLYDELYGHSFCHGHGIGLGYLVIVRNCIGMAMVAFPAMAVARGVIHGHAHVHGNGIIKPTDIAAFVVLVVAIAILHGHGNVCGLGQCHGIGHMHDRGNAMLM